MILHTLALSIILKRTYTQRGHLNLLSLFPVSAPSPPSPTAAFSKHALCHKWRQANSTSAPFPALPSSPPSPFPSPCSILLPFPLPPTSSASSALLRCLSLSFTSQLSQIAAPAPGPQARFLQPSHTCPRGLHPRCRSSVRFSTRLNPSLSRNLLARDRIVSSKVYAAKISWRTARRSESEGDECVARVRKVRRTRRKEGLLCD